MLPFAQRDIPVRHFDVACIDDAGEQLVDALVADLAVRQILRPAVLRLEKAFHFDLRLEPSRSISFQGFLEDRCLRLIADKKLSVGADALIAIADRRLEHVIAVHAARAHAVDGLLSILLTLMLGDAGKQVLDQYRI
ncbi:MAG: hypothetical protein AAGI03_05155 [Pseudomonadota bacterium]